MKPLNPESANRRCCSLINRANGCAWSTYPPPSLGQIDQHIYGYIYMKLSHYFIP